MQGDNLTGYINPDAQLMAEDIRNSTRVNFENIKYNLDNNINKLGAAGKISTASSTHSLDSILTRLSNQPKMVDYSNVRVEDVYTKLSDGTWMAPSEGVYSTTTRDQEDFLAKRQSSGDVWGNAMPKFLGKTLVSTAGMIAGTAYGITNAMIEGNMDVISDNSFIDHINDYTKRIDNKYAIHKTKEERELTGLGYWGNSKTWADDVLGGASFLAAGILSEVALGWATGGAAAATSAARWGARLEQASGFMKALNTARKLANPATKAYAEGTLATKLSTTFGKLGELGHTLRFTATSAGYEAAFEANAYKKESEENYYKTFQELNGRMPTMEEELDFRKNLRTATNGVFAFNAAILVPSNFAMLGKWAKVKNPLEAPNKWLDSKLFGIGIKKAEGKFVEKTANKFQTYLGKSSGFLKPAFVEGMWEEGMQSVGKNTASNWIQSKYDPKYTKNTYDVWDSFSDGLAETYGTAEGWKEVQIGMLIGLVGGAAGNKYNTGKWNPEYETARANNKLIVDSRNNYSGTRVAEAMAFANRSQMATEAMEDAEAKGDFTGQELSRQSAALAQLNFAYNLDYMEDAVEDTITGIKSLDTQTLMREYGVDEKGAEDLKNKMVDEYKNTAKTYDKYRSFAEYYIGNRLSKAEKGELKIHDAKALQEALAYELTLGEKANSLSSDILQSLKEKVAITVGGQELADALTVEDILTKAGKETKRGVEKKVSEISKAKQKIASIEDQYKKVKKTYDNSVSDEAKKSILDKLDNLTSQKQEAETERQQLVKEYEILFNAAKMKNPFGKTEANIVITGSKIDALVEQSGKIKDLVSDYEKINPQDALHISKLVEEYGRSLDAFQKYADLSRQLTDPNLGLRGKRNFISEIKRDKNPSEVTLEFLETLMPRMAEAKYQAAELTVVESKGVQEAVEEAKKKGATIEKPEAQTEEVSESEASPIKKTSIKDSIVDMINNSPYLLEYFGEGVPEMPSQEEIDEFMALAERAINDPKINKQTIAYANPYNKANLSEKNTPSLSNSEVQRLQELNDKFSKWNLLSGYTNEEGVSVKDMLMQQVAINQSVAPVLTSEVKEDELVKSSNIESGVTDKGEGIRNEEVAQVYQDVFIKRNNKGTTISHLTLSGLLDRMDISDEVGYVEASEDGKTAKKGSVKQLNKSTITKGNVRPGESYVVTFKDGYTATIWINKGGSLLIKTEAEVAKVLEEAGLQYINNTLTTNAGFSPIYDTRAGVKLGTDFEDSVEYSQTELYNMFPGSSITFSTNLAGEYNEGLINKYYEDVANGVEEEVAFKKLADNIQISITDLRGRKLGDLKANYDTNSSADFLLLREEAAKLALNKEVTITDNNIRLSKESFVKHLFLGVPNFTFEDGQVKYFDINPDSVVDYGYISNGELVLKNSTGGVRTDFIKGLLKKEGLPVVVFTQGKYRVAFPMNLKEVDSNMGDKALASLKNSNNLGSGILEFNNILAKNGISPSKYNLYYVNGDNQSLFENGTVSDALSKAVEELNTVKQVANVAEWMSPNHTKETLVNEASTAIDISNNPLTSPKPIIDFSRIVDFKADWYSEAIRTGELPDEKAAEIANKVVGLITLDGKEHEFSDHLKVMGMVEQMNKLDDTLKANSKDAQNKPCE